MVIATSGPTPYQVELRAGSHELVGDEPLDVGGGDTGPAPGQFLQLSLASCTAITLRMYAERKGWTLTHLRVEVDSERMEGKTIFNRQIYVEGNLTDDQRQRLVQIANACPVHRALTQPIEITTSLR